MLWTNFEKSKNLIFSKTAHPIFINKIYVTESAKEVLKKIQEYSVYKKGVKIFFLIFV